MTNDLPANAVHVANAPNAVYSDAWEHYADLMKWLDIRVCLLVNLRPDGGGEEAASPLDSLKGLVISEQEVYRLLNESGKTTTFEQSDEYRETLVQLGQYEVMIGERLQKGIEDGHFFPFPYLTNAFQLTPVEQLCVLVCLAVELDRKYEKFYAYLQDDVTLKYPTVDLIAKLIGNTSEERAMVCEAFAPTGKLVQYFLRREDESDRRAPLLSRAMRLDDRIVRFFLLQAGIDELLVKVAEVAQPTDELPALLYEQDVQEQVRRFVDVHGADEALTQNLVFYVKGNPGSGKKLQVKHLAQHLQMPTLFVDVRRVLQGDVPLKEVAERAVREAILLHAIIAFEHLESLLEEETPPQALLQLLEVLRTFPGLVFLLSGKPWKHKELIDRDHHVWIDFELLVPPDQVRKQLWERLSAGHRFDSTIDWMVMASKFRFTIGQMQQALALAAQLAVWQQAADAPIDAATLTQACYQQVQHRLEKKATRITARNGWDNLVLPKEQKEQLRNACNQMKYRSVVFGDWGFEKRLSYGRGLSMLFAGPPGTGKTMSAEVVAKELQLEIYKIDSSQVMSKYIGETEKNLQEIFAEAQLSGAILFFDEADALFGKRSEVKDSNDKFANAEVAYLLQKMEEYEGITILATNYQQNIDEAFMRRLSYVIKFPFPDREHRQLIWQGMFPPEAPLGADIDFAYIAERFHIAGGHIKNAVVTAAFLAAHEGVPVGMRHVAQAVRYELRKTGKLFSKEDFEDFDLE